ncbi:MAG: hypothetical protein IPK80_01290 [Nannocystis sp.]|nr:hypothetical protein [Nannocystis sp.]
MGVQEVRIVLNTGETVVFEQDADGKVRCGGRSEAPEPKPKPKSEQKPEHEPKPKPKTKREQQSEREPEKKPERGAKPQRKSKSGKAPKSETAPTPQPPRKEPESQGAGSLDWKETEDNGYHGVYAVSGMATWKALISRGSIWSLFRERGRSFGQPDHYGCFRSSPRLRPRRRRSKVPEPGGSGPHLLPRPGERAQTPVGPYTVESDNVYARITGLPEPLVVELHPFLRLPLDQAYALLPGISTTHLDAVVEALVTHAYALDARPARASDQPEKPKMTEKKTSKDDRLLKGAKDMVPVGEKPLKDKDKDEAPAKKVEPTVADKDKELLASFAAELDAMFDEEEAK